MQNTFQKTRPLVQMPVAAACLLSYAGLACAQSPGIANTPANSGTGNLDVLVPIALFAMLLGFGALAFRFQLKKNRMLHETLRLTIEKGQPIPQDLWRLDKSAGTGDLRSGLVCIALGMGIAVYGWQTREMDWAAGVIPFLVGCAFLIVWKTESGRSRD